MDPLKVHLKESTVSVEGPLRVSKWLASQVLLDGDEMAMFLEHIGPSLFYQIDRVVGIEEGIMSHETFLEGYRSYVECLKEGQMPPDGLLKNYFQSALSISPDLFYAISVGDGRRIIKALRPVVMLQPHGMHYSSIDSKFRSMVFSKDALTWGIQFSYPHIFQHPKSLSLEKVIDSEAFPNTALYDRIKKWIRYNTLPTPFVIGGRKVMVPVRLGKNCFGWINRHPQLISLGFHIANRSEKGEEHDS